MSDPEVHITGGTHGKWVPRQVVAMCEMGVADLQSCYHEVSHDGQHNKKTSTTAPLVSVPVACSPRYMTNTFAIWPK
jgi:hypothetical protein